MAITVNFYSFTKRDNSTKRPTGGAAFSASCDLKEECGIINPRLIVHGTGNPSAYNYAHISAFGRYYFISEWTWMLGNWECSLYVDVLATYKTEIGDSTEYIARASAEYDGDITDSLYPTVAIDNTATVSLGTPIGGTLNSGSYVLGVINDHGGVGAVEYFVLGQSAFASLCAYMFAAVPAWYDLTGITKTTPQDITEVALPAEVMKSLVNPMQYVVSCMFFGQTISVPTSGSGSIHFGWWDSGISASKLGAGGSTYNSGTFTLPAHPQAATRGRYLNLSPYTRYTFNAGPFGYFPIDGSYFADSLSGSYRVGIDCITGEGTLHIHDDRGSVIAVHRAQIGVPIKLAQITRDYLSTAANVVNTAADAVGGVAGTIGEGLSGNIFGAVERGAETAGAVANGIVSSIKSAQPVLTASGSGGSLYEINRVWTILAQHFLLAAEDNDHRGRPLARKKKISDIPGYIMVLDAAIATSGMDRETARVRSYMEGGFFYE